MASSSSSRPKQTEKPMEVATRRGRDYQGFRSKKEKEWYEDWFAKRPVVAERAADIAAIDNFEHAGTFHRREGWVHFLKNNIGDCNATICREFVASLIPTNSAYEYVAFVRGRQVPFNSQTLSQFMQIPLLVEYTVPYINPDNMPPAASLLEYLTGKPNNWDGLGKIESRLLLPPFYKIWMILGNCITPTSHKQDIYMPDILITYNLAKNNPICLVRYLISIIVHPSTTTYNKESIKMGVLLTKFCEHYGVQSRSSDKIIKQLGIVDNSTFRRSLGQLRERGEEGSDDEEERGEEEGPMPMSEGPHPQQFVPRVERVRKRAHVASGEGSSSAPAQQASGFDEIQQLMFAMEERQYKKMEYFHQLSNERYEALAKQEEDRARRQEEQYNEIIARFQSMDTRFNAWDARFYPPPPPP